MLKASNYRQPLPIINWDIAEGIIEKLLKQNKRMQTFLEVYKQTSEITLQTESTFYKAAKILLDEIKE